MIIKTPTATRRLALLACVLPLLAYGAEKPKAVSKKCEVPTGLVESGERAEWKGACADGRPQGSGTLIWFEKSRKLREFDGELVDGYPEGRGRLSWDNGKSYSGEFVRGSPTGGGEMRLPNGDRLQGTFRNGIAEGVMTLLYANGDQYEGALLESQPHGVGVLSRGDGSRLLARFAKGQPEGEVSLRISDEERYQGLLTNGKPHGRGILYLKEGELHADFSAGVAAGKGRFLFADGRRFDGVIAGKRPGGMGALELANGERCEGDVRADGSMPGRVRCTYLDGSVFEGTLRQGFRSGKGVLTDPGGGRFEGHVVDGLPQGQGSMTHAGGQRYDGEVLAGIRQGKGLYVWPDGLRFEGEFKAGMPEGSGSYQWPDGSRYSGEVSEGLPAGEGRMQWADGRVYQGKFIDGQADGPGVLTLADKTVYQGLFTEGLKDGKGMLIAPGGERTEFVFDNDVPREEKGSYLSLFKSKAEEINGLVAHFHGGWAQSYYLKHKEHFDANATEYQAVMERLATLLAEPAERKLGLISALTAMRSQDIRLGGDFAALKALKEAAEKPTRTLAAIPLLKQRGYRSVHAAVADSNVVGERAAAALSALLTAGEWQAGIQFADVAREHGWTLAQAQPGVALARAQQRRPELAKEKATELSRLATQGFVAEKMGLQDGLGARLREALAADDLLGALDMFRAAGVLGITLDRQALADALHRTLAARVLASQNLDLALAAQVFLKQAGRPVADAGLRQVLLAVFRERLMDQQAPQVLTYLREAAAQGIAFGDMAMVDEAFGMLRSRLDAGRWADALALFDAFRKVGIDMGAHWARNVVVLRSGQVGGNSPFPLTLAGESGILPLPLDSLGDDVDSLGSLSLAKHVIVIDVHPRYAEVRMSQRSSQKSSFAEGFQDVANPDYQQIEIEIQNAQMEYARATGAQAQAPSGGGSPSLFGGSSSGNRNADKFAKALELFSTIAQATSGGGSKPGGAPEAIMSQIQTLQARLRETPRSRREPVVTEYQYEELEIDVSRHVPVTVYLLDRGKESVAFSRIDLSQSDALRTALGIHSKDKTAKRHDRLDRIKQLERKATSLTMGDLAFRGLAAPVDSRPLEHLPQLAMSLREQRESLVAQTSERSHQDFDKALHDVLAGLNDDARSRDEQLLQIMRHAADAPYRESRDNRSFVLLAKAMTRARAEAADTSALANRVQQVPKRDAAEFKPVVAPVPNVAASPLSTSPATTRSAAAFIPVPAPPKESPSPPTTASLSPSAAVANGNLASAPSAPPVPEAITTAAAMPLSIAPAAPVDPYADYPETVLKVGDMTYQGRFKTNPGAKTISGTGTLRWDNGNVFVGTLVDSAETGRGKLVWANGQSYEGDWRAGKMHGRGEIRFPDGQIYKGDWKDGRMDGRGEIHFPDGNRYEGAVADGQPDGQGRMSSANGDLYEGAFRHGVFAGTGSFRWANGTRYTGDWADGKPHGRGEYTFPSGERSAGTYKDGVKVD